jgi:guanylate kinase
VSKGDIYVVSAPSGTGKTTLIKLLLSEMRGIHFSVSHTTRSPRQGESEGVDYHFVGRERFDAMEAAGDFLEWAVVHDHRYGTAARGVDGAVERGEDVLLDLDTQGAASVRKLRPEAILIFILPPGMQALRDRLADRGADEPRELKKRLEAAGHEAAAVKMYEYCVVNDSLERALRDLQAIIRSRRLRRERQAEQVGRIAQELETARPALGS